MISWPKIGSDGLAGIVNERSYVRPSIDWARSVANVSETPGPRSGSTFIGALRQAERRKEHKKHKRHKREKSVFLFLCFLCSCSITWIVRAAHSETIARYPMTAGRRLVHSSFAHRRKIRGPHWKRPR